MSSIGSTLYAALLRSHEMERQRKLEQSRYDDARYDKSMEQLDRSHKMSEDAKNSEFERKLKVAELMGKTAGATGRSRPAYENAALDEYSQAAYGAGSGQRQLEAEKLYQTRQTTAENEILGLTNNPWNDPNEEADRLSTQIYQRRGINVQGPLVNRTTPPQRAAGGKGGAVDVHDRLAAKVDALQTSKDMAYARSMAPRIINANPRDAAAQLSAIYAYIVLVDPKSSVKEGEIDIARATQSVGQRVVGGFLKAKEGGFVDPSFIENLQREAARLYKTQRSAWRAATKPWRDMAVQRGLNPDWIVKGSDYDAYLPDVSGSQSTRAQPTAPQPAEDDQALLDWLKNQ